MNVSEFKAKALSIISEIAEKGGEYVLTKKGVPLVRVVPIRATSGPRRGSLKGLISIKGDIVHLDTSEEWNAVP